MSEEDKEELRKMEIRFNELSRKYDCDFHLECIETRIVDSIELARHYKLSAYVPEKQIY